MTLANDFRECAESFVAREVRFMIVGGHAVMTHGYVRVTDDFDLWIDAAPDNAARVVQALADFGFGSLGLSPSDFTAPDSVLQLGRRPLRIDILTSISGVSFEACYPNRVMVDVDGSALPFIGRACLIANKKASGRLKDQLDVEELGGNEESAP